MDTQKLDPESAAEKILLLIGETTGVTVDDATEERLADQVAEIVRAAAGHKEGTR